MKSFLIIGMGKFGHHICENLAALNNEIMAVDEIPEKVEDVVDIVTSAKIGDCTKKEVLETFGVNNFDACLVCIGDNFQSSLEITYNLYEMGAKRIISLASTDIHEKFLLRNGASKVIYPEKDMAARLSVSISNDSVFDYMKLSDEYSIMEIAAHRTWCHKTVVQADIRAKHGINVLGIKGEDGKLHMPSPDYKIEPSDHIMVLGKQKQIEKLLYS